MQSRKLITEPYQTPSGFVDQPFMYVFDASGLTDGQTYMNLAKPLQGDCDFILRSIIGLPTCLATAANGGMFNFKNASGSYAMASQIVPSNVYTIVPEKLFPKDGALRFDLYNVLRDSACGGTVFSSFIAFSGVKRIPLGRGYATRETPYDYKERHYSYEYTLTLTQAHLGGGQITPPLRQVIPLDDFDFELLEISFCETGSDRALPTNEFQIMMYDANMHGLSDLPLNQGFVNAARATPQTVAPYLAVFPTPTLVYPAGGNIVFDLTSFQCTADPFNVDVSVRGIWRRPC